LGRFWGMLGRFMGMDGRAIAGRFWGVAGLVMPPPPGRAMPPPPGRAPPLPRWAWAGSVALKRVSNPMRGMSCRRLNMNVLER
jgi:hypothetical protein